METAMKITTTKWNISMEDYLKESFSKIDMSTMLGHLGVDLDTLTKRTTKLKLDRGGNKIFKLSEINDLAELISTETSIKEIMEFFKEKTCVCIYEQIEALKVWNNLPEYTEYSVKGDCHFFWHAAEDTIINDALKRGIKHQNIVLPMRSRHAIALRYNTAKKRLTEIDKAVIKCIKIKNKSENIDLAVQTSNKIKELTTTNQEINKKYYLFHSDEILTENISLDYVKGYKDCYSGENKLTLKIFVGNLTEHKEN